MKRLVLFVVVLALVVAASGIALSAANKENKGFVTKIPLNTWTVVAAQKGWLQEEFAKYGAKTQIVDLGALSVPGAEASLLEKEEMHFAFRRNPALPYKIKTIICDEEKCDIPSIYIFTKSKSGLSLVNEICHNGTSPHFLKVLQFLSNLDPKCLC